MARQNIENATNITSRINVMQAVPNVDINYGPYADVHTAVTALRSVEAVCQGLTVGIRINEENPIEEYWFRDYADSDMSVEQLETLLVSKKGVTDYNELENKPNLSAVATSGSYNDLNNKPKIGSTTLTSETTLSNIGAASQTDLSAHISNTNVHVSTAQKTQLANLPQTMKWEESVIKNIKIENGNKMIITVNGTDYAFRLTEWHDIADFYVLYANIRRSQGVLYININGTEKPVTDVTPEELMSLSDSEYGYTVKSSSDKTSVTFLNIGTLKLDYYLESGSLPSELTSMIVLYRTSGTNLPSLNFIAAETQLEGSYVYQNGEPKTSEDDWFYDSDIKIGEERYTLIGYFQGNNNSLNGNTKLGINFNIG